MLLFSGGPGVKGPPPDAALSRDRTPHSRLRLSNEPTWQATAHSPTRAAPAPRRSSTEQTSTSAPGRVPGAECWVLSAHRDWCCGLRTGTHGPNPISAQELDMVCFPSATFYWLKILAKEEDSVTRENSGRFRSQRPRIKSRVNPATAPSYVSVLGTIYTTEQSPESLKHRPLRLAKQTNKQTNDPPAPGPAHGMRVGAVSRPRPGEVEALAQGGRQGRAGDSRQAGLSLHHPASNQRR